MKLTRPALKLSHAGALLVMNAAIDKATSMGVPQCITVVDEGGNLLASVRMDGARVLSLDSSRHKAMTAATSGHPSANVPADKALHLAAATGGKMTGLPGGLPLLAGGQVVGGIGVGSGTGDQDLEVAHAAVAAFLAAGEA